jgi:glycosidase
MEALMRRLTSRTIRALAVAALCSAAVVSTGPAAQADLSTQVSAADRALVAPPLREPLTRERFYFVMTDRFANGNPANDRAGLPGGPRDHGFDPTHKGFYHGGDLRGIIDKLDYIKGMGTTAIWLTPSFKNRPVQGSDPFVSAGYHGYWITDFTQIDPHMGSNEDMTELVRLAHARGMKVFFDIITNHTADVISYTSGDFSYVPKAQRPYTDAQGRPFDDRDFAGGDTFPQLDVNTSFPKVPFFPNPGDATVKAPAWLNDPTLYHNRGDTSFVGENSEYGDFFGLDDLFTEHPRVVEGMTEIYKAWVRFGIDGFRVDTVKHVNLQFWQRLVRDLLAEARRSGNHDFFAFGEVFDANPAFMSQYTTTGTLQATLDFGFQTNAVTFARGGSATGLRDLFAGDDYYTDADSNAYQLPTFLGNHDMGRVGFMLDPVNTPAAEVLARDKFAHTLMYVSRGQPVVYYGDEQGFTGTGGDQDARHDMFASQVASYNDDLVIGGTPGSMDRFDRGAPLYRHIADLSRLRVSHPTLADGAQVPRHADDHVFAFSRVNRERRSEYLVAANNSTQPRTVRLSTYTPNATFHDVYGPTRSVRTDRHGSVTVTVPPLSVLVWKSSKPMPHRHHAPRVSFTGDPGAPLSGRAELGVSVAENTYAEVTFAYRVAGSTRWHRLGTDDGAPYRIFHDVSGLAPGSVVQYRAVLRDSSGNLSATSTHGVVR